MKTAIFFFFCFAFYRATRLLSTDCISLDKIALTRVYLLSDASTAFTILTDGRSSIA